MNRLQFNFWTDEPPKVQDKDSLKTTTTVPATSATPVVTPVAAVSKPETTATVENSAKDKSKVSEQQANEF